MQTDHDTAPRRASAAHIKAPSRKPAPPPTPVEPKGKLSAARLAAPGRDRSDRASSAQPIRRSPWAAPEASALLARLGALRDNLPTNKNDRAVAMIKACIAEGVRVDRAIVSALVRLGFGNRHAGGTLHRHTLGKGSQAYWSKGENGLYRVLD